jgi:hypothetical protein
MHAHAGEVKNHVHLTMAEPMSAELLGSEAVDPLSDVDVSRNRPHSSRRRVLVLVGAALAAAILVMVTWMMLSTDHSPPSSTLVSADARESRAADSSAQPELAPSASIVGTAPDIAVTPLAPPLAADTAGPQPAAVAESSAASGERGRADDANRIVHDLAQMANTLQSIQEQLAVVLAEVRDHPAAAQPPSSPVIDPTMAQLRQQLQRRDGEIAALRRELAAREQTITTVTEQLKRVESRPALPGWTVVGLTAKSAALRDPSGRTHVVATGEVIVDDIKLMSIDTAINRVSTTVGDMIYRAGTP